MLHHFILIHYLLGNYFLNVETLQTQNPKFPTFHLAQWLIQVTQCSTLCSTESISRSSCVFPEGKHPPFKKSVHFNSLHGIVDHLTSKMVLNHLNLKHPKIYNLLDLLGADSSGKFTLCSIFEHRIDGIYADLLLNAYWLSRVFHGLAGSEIADVAKNKLLTIKAHKF